MRKISLLKFTICLPFVAAIICAVYVAYTASVREQAAIHFQQSVDGKTSSKYSTGMNQLVAAYGQIEAAKIFEAKAKTVDTIARRLSLRKDRATHKGMDRN